MLGRRIDIHSIIDRALFAVPFILMCTVVPAHTVHMTMALVDAFPALGDDTGSLIVHAAIAVGAILGASATHFVFRPPSHATPAKLVVILLVTLAALALAAIDLTYFS